MRSGSIVRSKSSSEDFPRERIFDSEIWPSGQAEKHYRHLQSIVGDIPTAFRFFSSTTRA
jgi:hypothetical protein